MRGTKLKFLVFSISAAIVPVASLPPAYAATSSICNAVNCDNPQPSAIFDRAQDRPLDKSPVPSLGPICGVITDWKVAVVIAIIADRLNVSYVYTLVPTVVCR